MKTVKCNSGLTGSQELLQKRYNSLDEFTNYCELYNIHERLGYASIEGCWASNPTIQYSTDPSDLMRVYFHAVKKKDGTLKIYESIERLCENVKNSHASFGSKKATLDWINTKQ